MLIPLFAYIYRKTGHMSYYLKFHRQMYLYKHLEYFWMDYQTENHMDLTFEEFLDMNLGIWDFRHKVFRKFEL